MAYVRLSLMHLHTLWRRLNTPENRWAVLLCLMVILLIILTADQSPVWIYQGF